MDRRVVGWSAGRHVDHPCGGKISPWPARKVTEVLTLSQGKVIFGVIFESLLLDPEKSFLGHRNCHFWVRLWPNGVSQPNI